MLVVAHRLQPALLEALREDLDPVEQATAYGRLIDGGLTKEGAAEAVGVPQKTITARLAILKVPEELHRAIATGAIALSSVPTLVAMAKVSPKLAELVGRASPDRIDAWAAERAVAEQQGKHGLWPASHIDVERLELDDEQRKHVQALSDEWSTWRPRFGEAELDRARAAGVLDRCVSRPNAPGAWSTKARTTARSRRSSGSPAARSPRR